ncbi:PREDICTED: uncharacterized protein LOC105581190 isoform X3 [Cercocebus atys]|uniref:uncharacterized protein LOC105581190 isoform X3 n=1 Tax=Cercocebus atys TaxID=9531 RepID=UPI0005F38A47|nr:PREDICTED: uncharacterized protein LOC105581190 isoform X3 [Cercocebus atys]
MRLGSQVCFPEPGKITVEGRTLWGRSFQRPSGEVSQGQPGPEAEGQLQTPGQLQWRVSAAGGLGTRAALLGLNPVPRRPWPWAKALLSGPTGGKHTPGWRFKMLMRHATDEQAGAGTAHVHPEDPLPPNMFPSNASAHPRNEHLHELAGGSLCRLHTRPASAFPGKEGLCLIFQVLLSASGFQSSCLRR